MTLQDILNLIQGGPQQGLRPTGISGTNPLQSFGNRPSGQMPTSPQGAGANGAFGGMTGGMGSGGK